MARVIKTFFMIPASIALIGIFQLIGCNKVDAAADKNLGGDKVTWSGAFSVATTFDASIHED